MSQTLIDRRKRTEPEATSQETLEGPKDRENDSVSDIFWASPALEELARAQNVKPLTDVQALFGTWPDGEDDGFEAAVDELRHSASTNSCPADRQMRKSYVS